MALSNPSKSTSCFIRKQPIKLTPEELVRQHILHKMVDEWGYPKSLIQVEKALHPLRRRFDIVVFYKNGASLLPLLLIECKKDPCNQASLTQLLGYNVTLHAPFVGLADPEKFICYNAAGTPIEAPSYGMLLQILAV